MKNGKAEIIKMELLNNGNMHVIFPGREDRDLFIRVMKMVAAKNTTFKLISDIEIICELPK